MTDTHFSIITKYLLQPAKSGWAWAILFHCISVFVSFGYSYAQNEPKDLVEDIVVGGNYDYPPYEFIDKKGLPSGYSTELTYALAEVMGVNVHVKLDSWKATRERLETGKIDAIHGMYYSKERDKLVDFSPPHTIIYNSIFTRRDVPDIQSLENLKNKKVVVVEKGALHDFVKRNNITDHIIVADSDGAALRLISSTTYDYALLGKLPGIYLSEKLKLTNIKSTGPPILPFKYCFAVNEGNISLLSRVNEGLAILKQTGRYQMIYDKWLGVYEPKVGLQNPTVKSLLIFIFFVLLILSVIVLWLKILKKQVSEATLELKREIKERKLAEEALRGSESRYRAIVEDLPGLACSFQPGGKITFINKQYCDYFDRNYEKLIGTSFLAHIPESEHETIMNNIKILTIKSPTKSHQHKVITSDGSIRWQRWTNRAIFDTNGLVYQYHSLGEDITESKLAEEELKQTTQRLLKAQHLGKTGFIEWNIKTDRVYFSNEIYNLYGIDSHVDPSIDLLWTLIHPDDLEYVQENFGLASKSEKGYSIDHRVVRNDNGKVIWIHAQGEMKFETNGNPVRISVSIVDITERKHLEEQLRQSHKMEAIGTLAGGIAHDFNNVLSSIIGFTELALDDAKPGTTQEDNLREVYSAGKRAKDLVWQILTFARETDEPTKPIQVDTITKEVLKFIRSSVPSTIDIKQDIDSKSLIMGSSTQVHQIIMNLCTNAVHAMDKSGGIMEVSLKDVAIEKPPTMYKDCLKPGNYIEVRVSDTGSGIRSDVINSIFEPYFTTKPPGEGTGMGLAVVNGIVEKSGGKIRVESQVGKGSVFSVFLPITKKRHSGRLFEDKDLPKGTERILLVDDEAPIVKMGSQNLEGLGYKVTTRTSSVEALELFRSKPKDFDLVITDMTMPNMTGDILAVELMTIRPDIPVILCTGYSKKITDKSATEIGFRAFAYKPIVKADLAKTVRKVLDES